MSFKLPDCITPRPGEKVVAYQGKSRHEGIFLGYNTLDKLIVGIKTNSSIVIDDFLQVRPKYPSNRKGPCWNKYIKNGKIIKASKAQREKLNALLGEIITPGPSYYEFIKEIWSRGYEIFLVGGSVRDVINGESVKDVDLVTTMPFNLLSPLVFSMFGKDGCSRHECAGFMSVGLDAKNYATRSMYDPLIDLKNFFSYSPGTGDAQFGASIDIDYTLRDFACNAVYYDPINSFFIDPSGIGIEDAKNKSLNLINDTDLEHPRYKKADISFRFFKFVRKGYVPTDKCIKAMESKIKPLFQSIGHNYRMGLFRKYFLKNEPETLHAILIDTIKELMFHYGYGDIWTKHFAPFQDQLLGDD